MLVDTKARVGVFAIALGAYLPQFPSLVPEFEGQYADFKKTLPDTVELIDGGIVTTKELAMQAGDKFRAADVDLVILQLLTYATSYNMLTDGRDVFIKHKLAADAHIHPAVREGDGDHLQRTGLNGQPLKQLVEGFLLGNGGILPVLIAHGDIQAGSEIQLVSRRAGDQSGKAVGQKYVALQIVHVDGTVVGNHVHGSGPDGSKAAEQRQNQDKEGRYSCDSDQPPGIVSGFLASFKHDTCSSVRFQKRGAQAASVSGPHRIGLPKFPNLKRDGYRIVTFVTFSKTLCSIPEKPRFVKLF